jgi:serine/threonine protein kinase
MHGSLCPDVPLLCDYLAGRLPESTLRQVEQHLETCPQCLSSLDGLKLSPDDELVAALPAAPACLAEGPSVGFVERLVSRLTGLASGRPRTPSHRDCGRSKTSSSERLIAGDSVDPAVETARSATPDSFPFLDPGHTSDELGRMGPYRVLRVLDRGGMGVVFEAEDSRLRRRVAIKVLHRAVTASDVDRQRAVREARAAASLSHEQIVPLYDLGEARGVPFLVMPLLVGETLAARLARERKLPICEVLQFGRELAIGLAAAHNRGLVHRDIKPGNIWLETVVDRSHESGVALPVAARVRILDFGLARILSSSTSLTHHGEIVGTPGYLAPEQVEGRAVDARCDLFALGCVLYETATGRSPFAGPTNEAVLHAVLTTEPTDPQVIAPELPVSLAALIGELLRKEPAHRPATAELVANRLAQILTETGTGPSSQSAAAVRSAEPPRHRKTFVANRRLVCGLFAVGIAGTALAVWYLRPRPGRLVFNAADSSIQIRVRHERKLIAEASGAYEVLLWPGEYEIELRRAPQIEPLVSLKIRLEGGQHVGVNVP